MSRTCWKSEFYYTADYRFTKIDAVIIPNQDYPITNLFINQLPNIAHILDMLFPPAYINQRSPAQCGATAIKGDNKNPYIVECAHK